MPLSQAAALPYSNSLQLFKIMLKKIIHNPTFTKNVANPGIVVLVLLSPLSALFHVKVNNWLTFEQSFIYKNFTCR